MEPAATTRTLPGPVRYIDAAVEVPTSKSLTNRALVAAAVAGGGTIFEPLDCDDTRLLAAALADAGWSMRWTRDIVVGGRRRLRTRADLHLGNSGTGARLILSLLAAVDVRAVVDGTPRLRERPMGPLVNALHDLGAKVQATAGGTLPIAVDGRPLAGGSVTLRTGASSQFVSSLLLAAPLMERGLELEIEGPIPSRPYLDLTADMLEHFGARVERDAEGRRWWVGGGGLEPREVTIEGDWSAAPFMLAAAAVGGGRVRVSPLAADSRQGDAAVVPILRSAGLEIVMDGTEVVATGPVARPLHADLRDTPDLFPALAVVAAVAPAGSRITGLQHLRHKESDRLSVMVENLRRLGVGCEAGAADFTVSESLAAGHGKPVAVTAADDHRVAMAMAVAALVAGPLELDDDRCVAKSFPGFWQQWSRVVASAESTARRT